VRVLVPCLGCRIGSYLLLGSVLVESGICEGIRDGLGVDPLVLWDLIVVVVEVGPPLVGLLADRRVYLGDVLLGDILVVVTCSVQFRLLHPE